MLSLVYIELMDLPGALVEVHESSCAVCVVFPPGKLFFSVNRKQNIKIILDNALSQKRFKLQTLLTELYTLVLFVEIHWYFLLKTSPIYQVT